MEEMSGQGSLGHREAAYNMAASGQRRRGRATGTISNSRPPRLGTHRTRATAALFRVALR